MNPMKFAKQNKIQTSCWKIFAVLESVSDFKVTFSFMQPSVLGPACRNKKIKNILEQLGIPEGKRCNFSR